MERFMCSACGTLPIQIKDFPLNKMTQDKCLSKVQKSHYENILKNKYLHIIEPR